MNEGIDFKKLAKSNNESLRFIAKEMQNLSRRLVKTPYTEERMDQFKSNIVEASFFLNSYALGTRAFNAMVKAKQFNPGCMRGLVDFFMDEVKSMEATELKRKEDANKNND